MDISKFIFVFGSNLKGIHGKGAALHARLYYGAKIGKGIGMVGQSYAIPTKSDPYTTLPLNEIKVYVDAFIEFAKINPNLTFYISRLGCALAGYLDTEIAPMFKDVPSNCLLSGIWAKINNPLANNKLIVAGTRHLTDVETIYYYLDKYIALIDQTTPLEIVSGLAKGPDLIGKDYAKEKGYHCEEFEAFWDTQGKAAGHIRNQAMSWYSTHLIAFWDGCSRGTENMATTAKRDGLKVRVIKM